VRIDDRRWPVQVDDPVVDHAADVVWERLSKAEFRVDEGIADDVIAVDDAASEAGAPGGIVLINAGLMS
jgi:hypothetical protein